MIIAAGGTVRSLERIEADKPGRFLLYYTTGEDRRGAAGEYKKQ